MTTKRGDSTRWYRVSADEMFRQLGTSASGLTSAAAAAALARLGPNELVQPGGVSAWRLLLSQLQNTLILILLVATAVSGVLGHATEAVAISVIVLFAVFLGFVQEYRAEKALEALREMAAPLARVVREGREEQIPARDVVPGDVLLLGSGDRIPADARLIESINLRTEEAALTGESVAVEKTIAELEPEDVDVADRTNMVHAGTIVSYGRGRAVVVETGMTTEFGKIAGMLEAVGVSRTPLQENLDRVGAVLARAALAIVAVIVVVGVSRGQPFVEMFIFGIALAVAAVPEALPAVVTISLAIGVRRMVKRNALVRRLPAVETLGATSVICSDKTGTLTKDEMTIRKAYVAGCWVDVEGAGYDPSGGFTGSSEQDVPLEALRDLLTAGVCCSDATVVREGEDDRWRVKGDPTEAALVVAAAKAGLAKKELDAAQPRVDEIPFTSESKRMTTLHDVDGSVWAYGKGAPEVILEASTRERTVAGEADLDEARRAAILTAARTMAEGALRVLALARKCDEASADPQTKMTFLGLVGMMDPPRPEARDAIRKCTEAGIRVIMITGDHPTTAKAVAQDLGLFGGGAVVTGGDLDAWTDSNLADAIDRVEIFARVSPAHKLRVVSALQARGHVVAMTGDGVNDAPALKKADVGIAMGISGTDVSKEAAAMTLLDDNFASIVAAIEEGRGIFANIKKYLGYLLSSNIGEIGLIAVASALGMPLPLTAVQILYVNLATDGLPALALSVDPPNPDAMRQPPRPRGGGIFTRPVVVMTVVGGLWSAAVNVGVFAWALDSGGTLPHAMTMTFVTLVMIQFFKAYAFRSEQHSVLVRPLANRWLNAAVLWEMLLLMAVVYAPFLQRPFATVSLSMSDWGIVAVAAFSVIPILETVKVSQKASIFPALRESNT